MTNNEHCTHCGAATGLIEDDWGVWHCIERSACIGRQLGPIFTGGTPYQVAPLGHVERLEARIAQLADQLARAEALAAQYEQAAHEAITACANIARSHELNDVADRLEAAWYSTARPSVVKP